MMQIQQKKSIFEPTVKGDMVGDKPLIEENHVMRSEKLYDAIKNRGIAQKMVIAIGGPSGSGKSETSSIIATYLMKDGYNTYVISCDNYPHLPPKLNDENRIKLNNDGGADALRGYLGTQNEIDFARLSKIVEDFKEGVPSVDLRIMDNEKSEVYDNAKQLDTSSLDVIVLEGTWSHLVPGSDVRIFLVTTPEETLEHREKRGKDPLSPFGEMVLSIEQAKLNEIAKKADITITMNGNIAIHNN